MVEVGLNLFHTRKSQFAGGTLGRERKGNGNGRMGGGRLPPSILPPMMVMNDDVGKVIDYGRTGCN